MRKEGKKWKQKEKEDGGMERKHVRDGRKSGLNG